VKTKTLPILAIGATLVACHHDDYLPTNEQVSKRFQAFESHPDEKALRGFLNLRPDGEVCYLHIALTGKAFALHPQLFETVAANIGTEMERRSFRQLADLGNGVFEYYPEHKPKSFDGVFAKSGWLKSHRSQPSKDD